ncbi:MAG: murein L,D-transpeptidase family protein [Pseudomonadota bacterium]
MADNGAKNGQSHKPNGKAERTNRPAQRRRRWPLVLLIVCIVGLPIAAMIKQHWPAITASYDTHILSAERAWRRTYVRTTQSPLPATPDLTKLDERLASAGHELGDAVLMRIFKQEFELEVWLRSKSGTYRHFATYPICRFSGRLGPKLKEGDRQAPEGFYTVSKGQLNPNSRWHRSFNLGFPNLHDRSHNRTGSFLMVHGGCSSIGCYAMTNDVMDEIWSLVTTALNNGQTRFQVQAYPFRMTEENLAARSDHPWADFWRDLKRGHDLFEQTRKPPAVAVCNRRYTFAESGQGGNRSSSAPRIVKDCKYAPQLADAANSDAGRDQNRTPTNHN